ncbi:MAG: helix-turn-helix transcriptional regulator [Phycisphaerae bacterium]|nr:helix-turn-helix transcriptional regulator [Saprospiraceae bacterium]
MTLFIKNMVCARCIRTVSRLLDESGIAFQNVQLGEAVLSASPNAMQLAALRQRLELEGFELLDDRNSQLVTQIKSLIVNEIHHASGKKPEVMNFSDFLAREIGHEYSQLSKLFTSVEGLTIEKYIIAQRIERVKELLVYGEQTFSEIAWQAGYSSTQHLSNQFRQVTGLTPTQFKAERKQYGRKALDTI